MVGWLCQRWKSGTGKREKFFIPFRLCLYIIRVPRMLGIDDLLDLREMNWNGEGGGGKKGEDRPGGLDVTGFQVSFFV